MVTIKLTKAQLAALLQNLNSDGIDNNETGAPPTSIAQFIYGQIEFIDFVSEPGCEFILADTPVHLDKNI